MADNYVFTIKLKSIQTVQTKNGGNGLELRLNRFITFSLNFVGRQPLSNLFTQFVV